MNRKGSYRAWCPFMVPQGVAANVKATFDSRREAEARGNRNTEAYRCQHCGKWHLATRRR